MDFIERSKDQLRDTLRDVYFTGLKETGEIPAEFYMPCPRDGALTRLESLGDRCKEFYLGKCRNGHAMEYIDINAVLDGR